MTRRITHAITRELSPAITRCELTHRPREPIDFAQAAAQHHAYTARLEALGLSVVRLPAEPALPDAVFVEDTAVVLDELAIITRPGAVSRRPECATIANALRPWRQLAEIEPPGTLDGGDVLQLDRTLYVGLSSRSNAAAASQLSALLTPYGYRVQTVPVKGCLHLKSAASVAGESLLLHNPAWVDAGSFEASRSVATDPAEPLAANVLWLGDCVLMDDAYPRTAERLRAQSVIVHSVDLSELTKAEGAVTCCSLLFRTT